MMHDARSRIRWLVPLVLIGAFLAGCTEASSPSSESPAATETTLVASEFEFTPSQVTVQVGEPVTLVLENEGALSHNLTIERLDARTETIQSDASARLRVTPEEPGRYRIHCAVPGHAQAGMTAELIVER